MTNTPTQIRIYTIARNGRRIRLGFDLADYWNIKDEIPTYTWDDFRQQVCEAYRESIDDQQVKITLEVLAYQQVIIHPFKDK